MGGTFPKIVKPCPIQLPRPDDPIDAAKDNPPPNKTSKPHGSLLACSQVSKSVLVFSEGMKKKLKCGKYSNPCISKARQRNKIIKQGSKHPGTSR